MTTATRRPLDLTWDLRHLYESDDAFERERRELEGSLDTLGAFEATLTDSAANLAAALDAIAAASLRLRQLHTYASLTSDRDITVGEARATMQAIEALATRFGSRIAFVRPALLEHDDDTLRRFLDEEPGLEPHRPFLVDLMRQRPHILGPGEERILAESSLVTRDPQAVFTVLHNAEMPRPEMEDEAGETVRLDPVQFSRLRRSSDRDLRMRAFDRYFGAYSAFADTYAQTLAMSVKADLFRARARHYESCLEAAMSPDDVPVDVYHNLIAQVRRNLPLLHRYFKLRGRALGLERMHYADLYCPITPGSPREYSVDTSIDLLLEALKPMGQPYVDALREGFAQRWVDWEPTRGKRSGAYSNGWAYGVHPFVLMNYIGDHDSLSTLAHEMGHAMHSYLSNRTQPFPCADYTIFVAEVASTLNEALLAEHLLEHASDDERRFLLATELDGIRATLFRQTMFAEFELQLHESIESGETLTGSRLGAAYLDLQRQYHGHDEGVVEVPDAYQVEWAAVPHFHYNFYVYQYATGIVAAQALARGLGSEGTAAQERVLGFLSARWFEDAAADVAMTPEST